MLLCVPVLCRTLSLNSNLLEGTIPDHGLSVLTNLRYAPKCQARCAPDIGQFCTTGFMGYVWCTLTLAARTQVVGLVQQQHCQNWLEHALGNRGERQRQLELFGSERQQPP